MMKVVHINTSSSGGAAKAALSLHQGLLQAGVDSFFIYLIGPEIDIQNSYRVHGKFSLIERILFKLKLKKHYWVKAKQVNVLRKREDIPFTSSYADFNVLDSNLTTIIENADIIHLHWVAGIIDIKHFFHSVKSPVVWTLHDMNPFTGGCHHSFDCEKYIQVCTQCPQLIDSGLDLAKVEYNAKMDALQGKNISVVVLNEWMHSRSTAAKILRKFPHFLIQNSVDTNCFTIQESRIQNHRSVVKVGYVATYHSDMKGTDLFLNIVKSFQSNTHIHFDYIGKEFSLECSNLSFKGSLQTDSELADFYNSLDVLLVPSKADNSPNVILEALCCGCPVLASGVGGIPELITSQNGEIVKEHSSRQWILSLQNMITNINDFSRTQIASDAENLYNRGKQSNEMIRLYESVLR